MSEEKKASQFRKRRRHRKNYELFPYINNTLLFVLISMVVVVPLLIGLMSFAVDYVHTAQRVLTMDANDFVLDNRYEEADDSSYTDYIHAGRLIGSISCERVGLSAPVYYGINRAILREGVGMDNASDMLGNGGCTCIAGHASGAFGTLYNVKKGDAISVDTYWGSFSYRVTDAVRTADMKSIKPKNKEAIILATAGSTDAFSVYDDGGYYVVAVLEAREVR